MKNKPDAIFCADLHLRDDVPASRTDNYFEAQMKKIEFIDDLATKYSCPVLVAGDIFHKAKSSKALEIAIINTLNITWEGIPGNHDLPGHNIDKLFDSSLGVLSAAQTMTISSTPLDEVDKLKLSDFISSTDRTIGLIHKLVHADVKVMAGDKVISYSAKKLLKENPDCDIIVSGDNHQTFVVKEGKQLLVNPGSMMRMTADQQNHKPCIFLYYAESNTVKQVFLPIEENVISREHIDKVNKYNERLDSFVQRINDQFELSLSFEKNIESYLKVNDVREPVKNIIWETVQ